MAIANIKDLWELAATMMGANYASEIIDSNTDMSSPTTPVELTFAQYYDQVRQAILQEADWLFARSYDTAIAAPTKNWNGTTIDWDPGGRWSYVYRQPANALKVLGFSQDYNDLELMHHFQVRRLPIQWVSQVSTGGTPPAYTFPALAGYIYRGSVRIEVEDEVYDDYVFTDGVQSSTYHNGFYFVYNQTAALLAIENDYNQSTGSTFRIDHPTLDWSGANYPSTVTLQAAIEPATRSDWDEHIFTNLKDALIVTLQDVTDPTYWPVQFQNYVAAEMALRGAGVHAKSSKQIQLLRDLVLSEREKAITDLVADTGNLTLNRAASTTRQARW